MISSMLSDCEMCWETPCSCGWDERRLTTIGARNRAKFYEKLARYIEQNGRCPEDRPAAIEWFRGFEKFAKRKLQTTSK